MLAWLVGFTLTAMAAGPGAPVSQQTLCTSTITIAPIAIDNSTTKTLVGDTMAIRATVTSACQIQTVAADAFGHSVALSFDPSSATWIGNFSLASDPHTAFTLTVTVTDVNGTTARRGRDLIHDTPPIVTVTLPTPSTVGRPSLRVVADCADDDSAGCASMNVTVNGATVASGIHIDQDVSLAAYEGRQVILQFEGLDRRGQYDRSVPTRLVFVESNPHLTEVVRTAGSILDDSAVRTLYLTNDSDPTALEKSTGQIVPMTTSIARPYGWVTDRGAIFVAFPTPSSLDARIFELRDGVLTSLAQPNGTRNLHVAGDYAMWTAGSPGSESLFRRDLQGGATLTIAGPGVGNTDDDVAATGDVVYWGTDYQIYRYRSGAITQLTGSTARSVYPTTDGVNVAYKQVDNSGNALTTRLITSSGQLVLADFTGRMYSATHPDDYATNGGWTAFTKPVGADINVWLQAPDGSQSQVSFFGGNSKIDALNSDGAVTIRHNNRLLLAAPNYPLTDVSLSLPPYTRTFWRGGDLFVIIGASVFEFNAPPVITVQPSSQTVASGQTATLSVAAAGTVPLGYQWYAGTSGTTTNPISGATSSSYTTPPLVSPMKHWVRVSNAGGSVDSTTAVVSISFTDAPLIAATSTIKAVHINELRSRIDAMRSRYGLSAYAWTDQTLSVGATIIRAVHIIDLRTALAQVYAAAGLTPPTYTDPSLGMGTNIRVAHIAELRAAVIAIE